MDAFVHLAGLVVTMMAIFSFIGLRWREDGWSPSQRAGRDRFFGMKFFRKMSD